jgi:tripartite-type tricarboxylate transporter receptor subunit TctC
MRSALLRIVLAAFVAAASFAAHAQAWPNKTVRIIAVFPPGGSVDQVSRILAAQLGTQLGQTVIVENRGGASGSIGTQAVAAAAGDGYTWGVVFDTHAVNPALQKLPFDTLKDLAPVMLIGISPMAIVENAAQPYKDFRDVLAAAKAKPNTIAIGSIGTGSLGHLAVAQIGNQTGAQLIHVPYKGGGPLMVDALGNQVPLAIGSVFLVNPQVKAGKLKALGVTSLKPWPQMPGVAPIAEQGVRGFEALSWWGVFAPAKTPQPIVKRMYDELKKALADPGVAQKLGDQGIEITAGDPAELDKFLRGEMARWAEVVNKNNIKAGD